MSDKPKSETHPSFGVVMLSRVQHSGEKRALFASSILHDSTITLEICRAQLTRDLSNDWILPNEAEQLIEIEMSSTQFAEAITSIGNGSGTPVTITSFNGKDVPEPPFKSKRIQFDTEFEKNLQAVASKALNPSYAAINRILAKPNIGKKDRDEIRQQLRLLNQEIASNLPFIKEQFSEQMDLTVLEAKKEFDNYLETKIQKLGLEGFKKELAQHRPALLE